MPDFDYITDDAFRRSLQADWQELEGACSVKAWKAVHVLAGSIVEAAMIDSLHAALDTHKVPLEKLLNMGLGELVKLSKTHAIITERTADLSSVVRTYRNLIHPGRSVRLGDQVDQHSAGVARSLVEIVVGELAAGKRSAQGYSAAQLLSKIFDDPSVLAMVPYLLAQMTKAERRRLILDRLPTAYMQCMDHDEEMPDHHAPDRLRRCYRIAIDLADDPVRREAAANYVQILKTQPGDFVAYYELGFFRGCDLVHVNESDRPLVRSHLLDCFTRACSPERLATVEGLLQHLLPAEMDEYTYGLLSAIANDRPPRISEPASAMLIRDFVSLSPERQEAVQRGVKVWAEFADEKKNTAMQARLVNLRTKILKEPAFVDDEIPF